MTKTLTLLFALALSVSAATAQTFEEQHTQRPVTVVDGHRVITGFQSFSAADETIFANVLKHSILAYCTRERNALYDIDVLRRTFSFDLELRHSVGGKLKYTFRAKCNVRVVDGKLLYNICDISYEQSNIIGLSSAWSLDTLLPEKKPKQKAVIDAFQDDASQLLNRMFDAVVANKCGRITHWSDINIRRIVKGMTYDEALLAYGIPSTTFDDNDGQTQWGYGINLTLIFRNGLVETIIK